MAFSSPMKASYKSVSDGWNETFESVFEKSQEYAGIIIAVSNASHIPFTPPPPNRKSNSGAFLNQEILWENFSFQTFRVQGHFSWYCC